MKKESKELITKTLDNSKISNNYIKNNKITLEKSTKNCDNEEIENKKEVNTKLYIYYGIILLQLIILILFSLNYYFKIFYKDMKLSAYILVCGLILYTMNALFNIAQREKDKSK